MHSVACRDHIVASASVPSVGRDSQSHVCSNGEGTRLVVQAERKFHEIIIFHHVVHNEYVVLTPDNDRFNESFDEYSFYDRLHGRGRYPDAVEEEVHAFVELFADRELLRMVVNARARVEWLAETCV